MVENADNMVVITRIVYKEILPGDIRKFAAESNDSPSGGGARDLRFRPFESFRPIFRRMFPNNETDGIFSGRFYSMEGGREIVRRALFHPPTNARPGEGRLANVDKCLPHDNLPSNEETVILLLIQRSDGKVWPHFITRSSLVNDDLWEENIKRMILNCFSAHRRSGVSMVGFIDFETGEEYCNGK
jgi:hypothetical protein